MMARTKKIGLEYFPFDVDFFSDIKIRKLIKAQSGKAVAVYACLLCSIYKNGYYMKWDNELPFIISEQTGYDEVYIQEVIKSCMVFDLFSKQMYEEKGVLTSKGIQIRYSEICELLRRKTKITDFCLINDTLIPINDTLIPINDTLIPINDTLMQQIKGKEMKGKEKKINGSEFFSISELKNLVESWIDVVGMNFQCTPDEINEYFQTFCNLRELSDYCNTINDFKNHFVNWLRKEKEKEKSSGKKEKKSKFDNNSETLNEVLNDIVNGVI
jgi:hypothetical protein